MHSAAAISQSRGLPPIVDVDVLERDLLLTLAAMTTSAS